MDALASLRAYLEKPPRRKDKAPTGFDKQLKATSESPIGDVWVTLLEEGFQAWYAYFVADAETRAIIDELPFLELKRVAKELCDIVPHDDVKELFQHLFDLADRGDARYRCLETRRGRMPPYLNSRKRRRTAATDSPEASGRTAAIGGTAASAPLTPDFVQQLASSNRSREEDIAAQGPSTADHPIREKDAAAQGSLTAGHRIREVDATPQNPSIAGYPVREKDVTAQGFITAGHRIREVDATAPNPSIPGHRVREVGATAQGSSLPGHLVREVNATAQGSSTAGKVERLPFARHLSGIFPRMMLSSIIKKEGRAEVEMIQVAGPEQSRLKLYIYPQRVPYLAKEIFGLNVDIDYMWMHLTLENGANAKAVYFDGARHETLENCLGKKVAAAIRSTTVFSTEVERGEISTKCVSLEMKISPEVSYSLNLVLDPELLVTKTILAEIWPPP